MFLTNQPLDKDPRRSTIAKYYCIDEASILRLITPIAKMNSSNRAKVWHRARSFVVGIRQSPLGKSGVDALLNEFALSTEEGVVLMCLAEALLRVPDNVSIDRLIRDKLASGNWAAHLGKSDSIFVNASAWGLLLTGKVVGFSNAELTDSKTADTTQSNLLKQTIARLGEPVIRRSITVAMRIMGAQFVMGTTITAAITRAKKQERKGYRYSYDMLGEGARTMADADRYYDNYMQAITKIGKAASQQGPECSPGISVKLSALHPRYEFSQRERVMNELVPRLKELALSAKQYDIGLTVDAEEANRLNLSLDVIEAVFADPDLGNWQGFGLAIQAYQKRALEVVNWACDLAEKKQTKIMVRLVKGAYWDSEIKWSQTDGLEDYPVFTRKAATDISYQACAYRLLCSRRFVYPQFATHNALTVATVLGFDTQISTPAEHRQGYEFQRLHGMGEALFSQVMNEEGVPCRIYAPVGEHADLLAYLVRRLLENGANSSFVNNIVDENIPIEQLLDDPILESKSWSRVHNPKIPLPALIYKSGEAGCSRLNSKGLDLTSEKCLNELKADLTCQWQTLQVQSSVDERNQSANTDAQEKVIWNPANLNEKLGQIHYQDHCEMTEIARRANLAFLAWSTTQVQFRASLLRKLAISLEDNQSILLALCIKEAGKTVADAQAELREAVDFCRYYADQGEALMTGSVCQSRGVILCISPWNFPLAIFTGQVTAALVTGNTVLAKPAEQTSLIALKVHALCQKVGFPENVFSLIVAEGKPVGDCLITNSYIKGIMFTGSTDTAKFLADKITERDEADIPLIAETGGQNVMLVDSTALAEQVVDDVITSGFSSAGQRCSALRVLFLQEEIANDTIEMIRGAMQELVIGDPALLQTDLGPVIDQRALTGLHNHEEYLASIGADRLYRCELSSDNDEGYFFPPSLYQINNLSELQNEVFGPIVHVIRYKASDIDAIIKQINETGFGLTMGIHSRIQTLTDHIARNVNVGNIYVNRNMIGAVVGVQPFGGCNLSGTGPKAGGPSYLSRLVFYPDYNSTLNLALKLEGSVHKISDNSESNDEKTPLVRQFMAQLLMQDLGVALSISEEWIEAIENLIEINASFFTKTINLPGPTGEKNTLNYEPKGVIVLFAYYQCDLLNTITKLVAILITNNVAHVLVNTETAKAIEVIQQSLMSLGLGIIRVSDVTSQNKTLLDKKINGVIPPLVTRDSSHSRRQQLEIEITKSINQRTGALMPIIRDELPSDLLLRLQWEKAISIDTTAAGGNASLMTM